MAERWEIKTAFAAIKAFHNGQGDAPLKEIAGGKSNMTVTQAVYDLGRRFPLAATALTAAATGSGAELLVEHIPPYFSVRKLDAAMKDGMKATEPDEDEEEEEEESQEPVAAGRPIGRKKNEPIHVDTSEIDSLLGDD